VKPSYLTKKRTDRIFPALGTRASSSIEGTKFANASFPLTPALSLGERESRIPTLDKSERLGRANRLETILPLPRGEGRGEGEGQLRSPNAHSVESRWNDCAKAISWMKTVKPPRPQRKRRNSARERQM